METKKNEYEKTRKSMRDFGRDIKLVGLGLGAIICGISLINALVNGSAIFVFYAIILAVIFTLIYGLGSVIIGFAEMHEMQAAQTEALLDMKSEIKDLRINVDTIRKCVSNNGKQNSQDA